MSLGAWLQPSGTSVFISPWIAPPAGSGPLRASAGVAIDDCRCAPGGTSLFCFVRSYVAAVSGTAVGGTGSFGCIVVLLPKGVEGRRRDHVPAIRASLPEHLGDDKDDDRAEHAAAEQHVD